MTSKIAPDPGLAAFVVGDSRTFVPKPWPHAKFKEALVDTLNVFGDPWVICEHQAQQSITTDSKPLPNVTKLTIDAIKDYTLLKTGIKDLDSLRSNGKETYLDTFFFIGIETCKKGKENKVFFKLKVLSKNMKQPESEVYNKVFQDKETVSDIQKALSEVTVSPLELSDKEYKLKIPTILIVVEGGLDTIYHVANVVKSKLPVMLIRGSGMAADLIGFCLEDEHAMTKLKKQASLLFGICFSKANFDELKKNLNIIIENRSYVSEFVLNTEKATAMKDKVSESIIHAWAIAQIEEGGTSGGTLQNKSKGPDTSGTNGSKDAKFEFTPVYTNVSVEQKGKQSPRGIAVLPTQSSIQPKDSDKNSKNKANPSPLAVHMLYQIVQTDKEFTSTENTKCPLFAQELLLYALKGNLYNIAEALVDKGVTIPWSRAGDLFEKVLEERQDDRKIRTSIAGIIKLPETAQKNGKTHKTRFPVNQSDMWEVGCNLIPYRIKGNRCRTRPVRSTKAVTVAPAGQAQTEDVMIPSDLLLWAVLTDKIEMSEIFWKRSPEPILTALIASVMLRRMSRRAHWLKETIYEQSMITHSRVFCQRAIDTTQRLYDHNPHEAIFALEVENKDAVWGINESALEFSLTNKIYKFVTHHVTQRSFNKIWEGGDFTHFSKTGEIESQSAVFCRPRVKARIHYLFFCGFLVCLSAFVMTNIRDDIWPIDKYSVYEYCVYIYLIADIFEEYVPSICDTIFCNWGKYITTCQWRRNAWVHLVNFWNAIDLLSYLMIILGASFRFGYEYGYDREFIISRRFYSIGLFLMYSKVLQALLIPRKTGPTILMLKEGLNELLRFLLIMVVLIVSVGVFYHANLYPNHYDLFSPHGIQYWSFWKIIYLPYWSIYGEFKPEIDGEDSTDRCSNITTEYRNNPEVERCPQQDFMVSILSGFFVLILNLLLVNLIIAMFSFRFSEIQENADLYWRFHRSRVIMDFRNRVPVPFNLLLLPLTWCLCCKGRIKNKDAINLRAKLNPKQEIFAREWKYVERDS
ncbi:transient receptor potential cation channel subfamily M member 2-like [Argopecten irradians]|uniref:transient receptor potential cation channel subfamily M member 2-like n=1 Tax=Argopecten irradians TaxID=31199 RepID=UPI003712D331